VVQISALGRLNLAAILQSRLFQFKMRPSRERNLITTETETRRHLTGHARRRDDEAPEISVFLPVFNEEPNLRPLHEKLDNSLAELGRSAEIIYVDDGSSDGSLGVLREIAARDDRVRVIALRRNYGQTPAMAAGIDAARGQVLIPMDADLQNDPADIARLLEKIDEGFDVVSGWRKNRKDPLITRKIPSQIANWLISKIGGVPLHDYGCSLKAYRRESLADVQLYGEMHRFIPIYASWSGARVTEIPVEHHPRTMGKSKYGLSRTIKVIFDLMTIKFMASYQTKPLYVFGWAGLLTFAVSLICAIFAFLMKFASWPHHADFIQTPLPVLTICTRRFSSASGSSLFLSCSSPKPITESRPSSTL